MKTAVVHDWLMTYAGAERVLEQILQLYPDADLFSLLDFIPENERRFLQNKKVRTSFLQGIPFARKKYRSFLPLMPWAIERFNFSGYDLVISSSHAVAKGAVTGRGQTHICYCHTPARYVWDMSGQYLEAAGLDRGVKGAIAKSIGAYIKRWDIRTSDRVNHFIANSGYIAERIKRAYGRDSEVIYPPVDTDTFELNTAKEDFYITASRMVPYKKVDLIVEAFAGMPEKKLVVLGDGPGLWDVKSISLRNVELLGHQPLEVLKDYMQRAKAFVFAAEEDFGIAPVEAQACGTPVIAYGGGGARETVVENKTGIFFKEQTVESLAEAVRRFEDMEGRFKPAQVRTNAERFGTERFRREFRGFVEKHL